MGDTDASPVADDPYDYITRIRIRDRQNPFEYYSDAEFLERYRLSKHTVKDVILPLVEQQFLSNRGLPLPTHVKLLTSLRFYATGAFQAVCGELEGVAQSTVSRIIQNISKDLTELLPRYVRHPKSKDSVARCKRLFYDKAEFPGCLGCIDCIHVPIANPGNELYRNKNGWFSLNVQIVAGPNLQIMDIVCRWPGTVHDAAIFHNSRLKQRYETKELNGILLGDSSYPLLPYLFTPISKPESDSEMRYNISHSKTRSVVDSTFEAWKCRFPCLAKKHRVKLFTSQRVVLACAVLHNIAIQQKDPIPEPRPELPDVYVPAPSIGPLRQHAAAIRAAFIERHFVEIESSGEDN